MRRLLLTAVPALALVGALLAGPAAQAASSASGVTIYNSIPTPLPGNLVSQPFEAQQVSEFGDKVTFAGTARLLKDVTITMSSWACQTGSWVLGTCASTPGATSLVPITVKLYTNDANAFSGTSFAAVTQTVAVPYRPSASANCTGTDAGKWYDAASATCFSGKAANVTIDFSALNVTLPNTVIYGISYNTSNYGPTPYGPLPCSSTPQGCFYDSLNVGVSASATTGTDVDPDGAFLNSATASVYCDGGTAGTFRNDHSPACWTGYVPSVRFGAANPPASKDACKRDGWKQLTDDNGKPFKNQGACESYLKDKNDKDHGGQNQDDRGDHGGQNSGDNGHDK
ncbi:MAG: hypothetical protein QOJ67_638 [Acidimicrobiaceae bacterium]|jgi:hypothetical protein